MPRFSRHREASGKAFCWLAFTPRRAALLGGGGGEVETGQGVGRPRAVKLALSSDWKTRLAGSSRSCPEPAGAVHGLAVAEGHEIGGVGRGALGEAAHVPPRRAPTSAGRRLRRSGTRRDRPSRRRSRGSSRCRGGRRPTTSRSGRADRRGRGDAGHEPGQVAATRMAAQRVGQDHVVGAAEGHGQPGPRPYWCSRPAASVAGPVQASRSPS